MLDMLINFERSADYLSPVVLLCIGIVAVAVGLVSWLAGMALRKLFLFITGAITGAIVGLYFVGRKTISAAGLAALFAVVAAFLDKLFVTLLAAALAVIIAVTIMAWHYDGEDFARSTVEEPVAQLNGIQTIDFITQNIVSFVRRVEDVYHSMPSHYWLICPVLIVLFIAAGIFLWNPICAWLWATTGTILIFAGMIALLLYKGSAPISAILDKGNYYAAVFTAMMALGTIVQLLLFHHIKTKGSKAIAKPENQKEQPQQQGWRGL
jgi:hypothetical protein